MTTGHSQRQRTAIGIADDIRLFNTQGIKQTNQMINPAVEAVGVVRRAFGITKTEHVRCNHPPLSGQYRNHQTPVGPGRYARTRAMNQQ